MSIRCLSYSDRTADTGIGLLYPGSTPASGRRRDSTDSVGEIATSMRRQVPDRGSASHSRNRADDVEFAAGRLQQ